MLSKLRVSRLGRAAALVLASLMLVLATANFASAAASGDGTMTVSPASVGAGTSNTLVFVFTNDGTSAFVANSRVTLLIPAGWTAPTAANTTISNNNCAAGTPTFGGQTITVPMTCGVNSSFQINYTGTAQAGVSNGVAFTTQSRNGNTAYGSITTQPTVIVFGAADHLEWIQQPTNTVAGASMAPPVTVVVQDSGNRTVTSSNASVVMAITTGPSGTLSGSTTVAAVNGIATFSNLSIDLAGNNYRLRATSTNLTRTNQSGNFNITVGAPNKVVFTTQPGGGTGGTAWGTQPVVTIQDAAGNTITGATNSITLAITPATPTSGGPGTLVCTQNPRTATAGVATFAGCNIDKVGTGYTLTATAAGLASATSNAFNVTLGAASKLAFTTQPSNTAVSANITPAVVVTVQDAGGNTVTTSTASITITKSPATGTLSGGAARNAVNGVATFNALSINAVGTGFTLTATATGPASATSVAFNVTNAPLSITFYKRICSDYTQVPGNQDATLAYTGWNGNDTGGHNGQLNVSGPNNGANSGVTSTATDLVCDPYTGTWTFSMWDQQDAAHRTNVNPPPVPSLLGTATTSGLTGSTTVTLNAAELALARVGGLWITEDTLPGYAGFGAIRCYDDIHYSDNSETLLVSDQSISNVICIAYNVKPKITFAALPNRAFGDPPITLSATTTATGAGPVITFTAIGNCATSGTNGTTLTITGSGSCTVTAHEAIVNNTTNFWSPADDVSQSFTIGKLPSTTVVTWAAGPYVYKGSAFTATAVVTGPGGLSQTLSVTYTGDCTNVTVTNGCTASASYAGNANYDASSDSKSITIVKAPSTTVVTFEAGPYTYKGSAFTATANVTGAGGLNSSVAVTYGGDCTNVTVPNGCTASATYPGDSNHTTSTDSKSITIVSATPKCSVTAYSLTYDGSAHTATGSCVGANGQILSGLNLTGTTHTDAADYASDPWTFYDPSGAYGDDGGTVHDVITKAPSTTVVSFGAGPYVYKGSAFTATDTVTGAGGLNTSAAVVYTGDCINVTVGGCTATASYSGDANHDPSSDSKTIIITKAPSTTVVSFGAGPYVYKGSAFTATDTVTGAGGLNTSVGVVYTGDCINVTVGGCTATASYSGDANHDPSSDSKTIIITKAPSTTVVSFGAGPYVYKGSAFTATATTTGAGGLMQPHAPTYISDCTNVTVGGCTATASYSGDANHDPSSDSKTIIITKANPNCTITPYAVPWNGGAHTATGSCLGVHGETLVGLVLTGTTHTNVGDYLSDPWTFTDSTGNYNNDGGTVHDSIGLLTATCTITGYSVSYDGGPHTATGSCLSITGQPLAGLVLTATTHTNAGDYPSDAWTFHDPDGVYADASGTVHDIIGKARPFCTITGYTVTYDGSAHTATGTCLGVNDEPLGGLDLSGTTHTPVGNYSEDPWVFAGNENYGSAQGTVNDRINDASATPTPFETIGGETATPFGSATPGHSATPPVTSSGGSQPSNDQLPLAVILIAMAFGLVGLLAVEAQRRSLRRQ